MKSAVPTRTIEVSAHIQIAVDKERRGSPDITHLKPHPLHTGSDLKKKNYPTHPTQSALQLAACGIPRGRWDRFYWTKMPLICICFQWSHLCLTGDHIITMYFINNVWHVGIFRALLNFDPVRFRPTRVQLQSDKLCGCLSEFPEMLWWLISVVHSSLSVTKHLPSNGANYHNIRIGNQDFI